MRWQGDGEGEGGAQLLHQVQGEESQHGAGHPHGEHHQAIRELTIF